MLGGRYVTVNLFERTYVYLVYIYLLEGQFVTVKSIYPICHHVREHMCASKHTSISSQLMYMIYVDNDNVQYMYIYIIYYVTQYGVSRTNA